MSYCYFTTEWIVRPVTSETLRQVLHSAGRMRCLLYQQGSRRNEDGLFVVPFVVRAPSPEALDDFVRMAGGLMGLIDWDPAPAAAFEGAPFMGSRIGGFVEASLVYGRANHVRLRQLGDPTDTDSSPAPTVS